MPPKDFEITILERTLVGGRVHRHGHDKSQAPQRLVQVQRLDEDQTPARPRGFDDLAHDQVQIVEDVWVLIDQERINSFADATLDHQFIHVDAAKAATTPFGGTIAHGYLTMSLISYFLPECSMLPKEAVMGINYGSNKMRFLQPVPVDSEVRGKATLREITEKTPGQLLLKNEIEIQIKGEDKPALVAEILSLFIVE